MYVYVEKIYILIEIKLFKCTQALYLYLEKNKFDQITNRDVDVDVKQIYSRMNLTYHHLSSL